MSDGAAVLDFWTQAGPDKWFKGGEAFDEQCRAGFAALWHRAAEGGLSGWEATPNGALALVILMDQLPRNMFRGSPEAYATDAAARGVSERAIAAGFDRLFAVPLCRFFYLPYSHSEALADQDRAVALNEAAGDADGAKWARHHRDIVARFGRFPHRNAVLGRETTPDEAAWLADEGAFKG